MSTAHHLLKALYAFLRLLKLPQGLLHRLCLRLGLVSSKLRQALSSLGYWAHTGQTESTISKADRLSDTDTNLKPGSHDAKFTLLHTDHDSAYGSTSVIICASAVPPSASAAGPTHGRSPPMRQRSLSYPNLRQTFAPVTTTFLSPRPRSIHLPSPIVGAPTFLTPSHSSTTLSIVEPDADFLAQARAQFIEADSRSERRVRRARDTTRSALGGPSHSRSRSRQPRSRPSSQAPSPSVLPQYPPSLAGSHISLAPSASEVGAEYGAELFQRGYMAQSSAGSPAPSIQLELEPPSPEQERGELPHVSGDRMEVNVQFPSTESLPSFSNRCASPSPSRPSSRPPSRRSHISYDDEPVSMSTVGGSEDQKTIGRSVTPSLLLPVARPGRVLLETTPEQGPRYIRQCFVPEDPPELEVPRVCLDFPHSPGWQDTDLRGWMPVTHPEGCLYFYHRDKHIFTDAYLYLQAYLDEVEELVEHLEQIKTQTGVLLPSDYELVVQITFDEWEGEESVLWQYYYVHHETRSLFWLQPFHAGDYLGEISGPVSPAHFKHMLETWYWDHVSRFPNSFRSHDLVVEELIGDLTFFCTDYITSPMTTIPYPQTELMDMIKLLGGKEPGAGAISIAASLGRMMSVFSHWRYIHFHGQRYARMDRHESIRQSSATRPRTWLMKLFSCLFLFAPEVHLSEIEKLYVDGMIVVYVWKRHITKLQDEWQELITYATIILTASVSLLSVPDVILFPNNPNGTGGSSNIQGYDRPLRSPAAIASYISILCSTGSIVLGLMLVRQHRTKNRDFADEASAYMAQQDRPYFHHEPLAILYSLPYALLMWAMLSFLASVMIFTLLKTDIATQSTIAAVSVVVSCLIVWCAVAAWDREASPRAPQLWDAVNRIFSFWKSGTSENLESPSSDALSEKSRRTSRVRLRSIAHKIRGTKSSRINEV
ncbi:hypothetical protein PENSPDRAFT_38700 [Peniophora sp. CONT]|nr:hypothetical protein PENSPDRAFT_38700 [Peniophora sp. CONT]